MIPIQRIRALNKKGKVTNYTCNATHLGYELRNDLLRRTSNHICTVLVSSMLRRFDSVSNMKDGHKHIQSLKK